MSIQFTDREIEVATRWTIVHSNKLLSHLRENPLLNPETIYEYHSRIGILIHTMKERSRDTDLRIRIIVFLEPYQHDKFFSYIIKDTEDTSYLHNLFDTKLKCDIRFCVCGRLGKNQYIRKENVVYECDNCYIYGFVRGEECPICKEDDGKPWLKTSCEHHFHDMCWYRIHEVAPGVRKCPLCRSEQYKDTLTKL